MTRASRVLHIGTDGSRSIPVFVVFLVIFVAALATRLLPLSISQYPYNNDSLIECGMASEISSAGHLEFSHDSPWYGTHSVVTPVLDVLLSFTSSSLGTTSTEFAQVLTAIIFALTACGIFILARIMTGNAMGGLGASIAAITLGTFVFTTGSAWKVSLGMALLTLLFIAYAKRDQRRFRFLTFLILLMLPLVHHLVTAVGFLAGGYFLTWSWLFALTRSSITQRHFLDTITVAPPLLIGLAYYGAELSDRLGMFSSMMRIAFFVSSFLLLAFLSFAVMSLRSHVKWTFAPVVGMGMLVILSLDYAGILYPYSAAASDLYVLLILASSFIVAFAWYGAEIMIEKRQVYRAIMLGLFMSPLTIILFGLSMGFTGLSHQILYRGFDFLDFFIFVGLGLSVAVMSLRQSRRSRILVMAVLACLLITFPFGYFTSDLLGVRHDTAAYEADAVQWIAEHNDTPQVVSDERLGRIAYSLIWVEKRSYLPHDLLTDVPMQPGMFYIMEDSWTGVGVNDYPYGRAVIPDSLFSSTLDEANVVYIGGPRADRLHIFSPQSA